MSKKREWDQEELELFKYMYEHGSSHKELKLAFNISDNVIRNTAKNLEIKSPLRYKEKDGLYFCPMCNQYKAKELFYKRKMSKYGIAPKCKECEKAYKKQWKIEKEEKIYNPYYKLKKTKEEINKGHTRVCKICEIEKSVNDFNWNRKYESLLTRCKICDNKLNKENKLKRLEKKGY